mgnify:FL=1|tara:strand:+ start:254 stop:547 length:294 start_codon:yes stop_codon:yes gene_type:complete
MSDEFSIDIDKALEQAKNNDLSGFDNPKPDALQSVITAINNSEQLSGLDHKLMKRLMEGTYTQYETLNSSGLSSKRIVIEYDVSYRDKGSSQEAQTN